uniref:zinc finger CCCH domain-containing protein 16-like n=1 Tax=Erigeron canadensis TaxID=72917 RepID=UPI001CB8CF89|nr:zinc finger CCCH domain-containing protein 16-like [Erigeron canadensis]
MHPRKELCRNFQRGYCQYGERCRFLHASQQQQAKPNPFGLGTQSSLTFPNTNSSQPQKPNPFGFGVKNNSQTTFNSNQFKPGENKWSRFGPTNAPASQKEDKQSSALNHVCTDSESCKSQIAEDLKNEKPVWKLTCYGHSRNGPCDIVGDISYEELRAVAYDEVKRGTGIQSIVERERSLLSSKLIEFENLLRNPYPPPQNSTLTTQNAFPRTNVPSSAPGFNQVGTNFNSGANTNLFSQTMQNIGPTPVTSFSQLNTSFQMSSAASNNAFGPVSQFQAPTQISTASQNTFAFGIPGQLSSQPSQQSFVSSFPASASSFTNQFPVAATSPNLDSVHQQPSGPFGVQNPSANAPPGAVSSLQMTQNLPSASSDNDNSIWLKDKWRAGEIPEEAPPDGVVY